MWEIHKIEPNHTNYKHISNQHQTMPQHFCKTFLMNFALAVPQGLMPLKLVLLVRNASSSYRNSTFRPPSAFELSIFCWITGDICSDQPVWWKTVFVCCFVPFGGCLHLQQSVFLLLLCVFFFEKSWQVSGGNLPSSQIFGGNIQKRFPKPEKNMWGFFNVKWDLVLLFSLMRLKPLQIHNALWLLFHSDLHILLEFGNTNLFVFNLGVAMFPKQRDPSSRCDGVRKCYDMLVISTFL